MKKICLIAALFAVLSSTASLAEDVRKALVNEGTPVPDCSLHVNIDRNGELPGYSAQWGETRVCLPFTLTNQLLPASATVQTFYIDEFSDARIRSKWEKCKADADCRVKTLVGAKGFTRFEARDTGTVDKRAEIDFDGAVDLTQIRRPAYFGQGEYSEAIAKSDPQTFVVEFTVPRDNYEVRHLNLSGDIKLRGWYFKGAGIADDSGKTKRALVIMNNGGGSEIAAIDDPKTPPYHIDVTFMDHAGDRPRAPSGSNKMSDEINHSRRRFAGIAAAAFAGAQLGLTRPAAAQNLPAGASSAATASLGPLKQTDAGVLNVGYAESGPATGPVVILLHGWPYDINAFVEVAPLLAAKGYRVIVPHLRGYGTTRFLSDATMRNGQPSAVASDIIALMDALKIDKAVVAGFDWGARTANIMAALWPERVVQFGPALVFG